MCSLVNLSICDSCFIIGLIFVRIFECLWIQSVVITGISVSCSSFVITLSLISHIGLITLILPLKNPERVSWKKNLL